MPTLDDIRDQISQLDGVDTFGTKKEIKSLPEILSEGEKIVGLTSGLMNGNTWLMVATNRRVIFLDKGMLYGLKQLETPLAKINSVEHKTGLVFGEIAIWDGSSKMVIKNCTKQSVPPFVAALKNELQGVNSAPAPTQSNVADELKKLADLREQGVISEDEFDGQKKKLLAA